MSQLSPHEERIEDLARRVQMEHSLQLGEAIGNALAIASEALASLGSGALRILARRRAPRPNA